MFSIPITVKVGLRGSASTQLSNVHQ